MALTRYKKLKHIPGNRGNFLLGHFFEFVNKPQELFKRLHKKYGDIFYLRLLHRDQIVLLGQNTNKIILVDEWKKTENKEAWETALLNVFPNALMLMDGVEHKYHRSIMLDAFKKDALQGYLDIMPPIIEKGVHSLKGKSKELMFPFYKNYTLRIAAIIFFGLDEKVQLDQINNAVTNMVNAAITIPVNLPGTKLNKGIKGRKYLSSFFESIIKERRKNPGKDLFSKLCLAKNEEGDQFSDREIIDHLNFILMASHDTTAISLSMMTYLLAKNPEWQERLREEARTLNFDQMQVNDLRKYELLSQVLKETLRIHPPLTQIVRKLNETLQVEDQTIPKDTLVSCNFQFTHNDERTWKDPHLFDPNRFSRERKEHMKCPYAYAPFGAGPHHCIGYAFAEILIKKTMIELLLNFKFSVPQGYECDIRDVPLKQPKDDLPIYIEEV